MNTEVIAIVIALVSLVVSTISLIRTRKSDEQNINERIASKRTEFIKDSRNEITRMRESANTREELLKDAEKFLDKLESETDKKQLRNYLDDVRFAHLYATIESARLGGYYEKLSDYSNDVDFIELEQAIGNLHRYQSLNDESEKGFKEIKKIFDKQNET